MRQWPEALSAAQLCLLLCILLVLSHVSRPPGDPQIARCCSGLLALCVAVQESAGDSGRAECLRS